ncbi:MAG: pentapeptide repeat-containing protein [Chromatiales bacterium]|jgi:hypothetical protein
MDDSGDLSHDKIWFVKREGKVFGPFAAAKVRRYLLEQKIELQDEVSQDRKSWKRIGQVAEVVPLQMRDPNAFDDSDSTDELDPGKKGSLWLPLTLAVLLLAGGIGVSLLLQMPDQPDTDCTTAPAPSNNWNGCNKKGLNAAGKNLDHLLASNALLTNAKLSGASLKAADLRYASLFDADLSYANLEDANLKGADLHHADLSYAVLTNADLRYADLTDSRLGGVELRGAKLDGAIWSNGKPCQPGSLGGCVQ